ncbi:hypothetical protein Tco_0162814 [Tanacetum coccineum]
MSNLKYVLTVNPTIYTSCIKQFWATAKVKTVNEEVQIQALVDGKKLTLMGYENHTQKLTFYKAFFSPQWKFLIHTSLQCLSAKTTAWNEFSSIMASAVICLATNQKFNFSKVIFDIMVKRTGWVGFKFLKYPSGSTEPITDEAANEEHVPTHSNDPLLSGEDRLQLKELLELCTKLSERVLDLENTKTSQAAKITKLKERVKKLERGNKSSTLGFKRLRKVGRTARIESSKDEGLGDQEDASKQGRKITDLDADAEVTLVDDAQGRNDDNLMFDIGVFDEQEVEVEKVVSTDEVTTISATTTTVDELTLAQSLIKIKVAKPKAVTTTTTAITRPKARGVVVQEPNVNFRTNIHLHKPLNFYRTKGQRKAKDD